MPEHDVTVLTSSHTAGLPRAGTSAMVQDTRSGGASDHALCWQAMVLDDGPWALHPQLHAQSATQCWCRVQRITQLQPRSPALAVPSRCAPVMTCRMRSTLQAQPPRSLAASTRWLNCVMTAMQLLASSAKRWSSCTALERWVASPRCSFTSPTPGSSAINVGSRTSSIAWLYLLQPVPACACVQGPSFSAHTMLAGPDAASSCAQGCSCWHALGCKWALKLKLQ